LRTLSERFISAHNVSVSVWKYFRTEASNVSAAIIAGPDSWGLNMPDTDVQKALGLLKEARELLKNSEVGNLKKSAGYLKESIQWLSLQHSGEADNVR